MQYVHIDDGSDGESNPPQVAYGHKHPQKQPIISLKIPETVEPGMEEFLAHYDCLLELSLVNLSSYLHYAMIN